MSSAFAQSVPEPDPLSIRFVTEEDAEATRAIYNHEVTESTVTFDLVPRSLEEQQAWIKRHSGAYPAIVAVRGQEVVGFASLSPYRERPAYATTVEDSVYVGKNARRQGVGKALLEKLSVLARANGFHAIIARCSAENLASVSLHEACGFVVVGHEREVGRKFGRWLDVIVLERML